MKCKIKSKGVNSTLCRFPNQIHIRPNNWCGSSGFPFFHKFVWKEISPPRGELNICSLSAVNLNKASGPACGAKSHLSRVMLGVHTVLLNHHYHEPTSFLHSGIFRTQPFSTFVYTVLQTPPPLLHPRLLEDEWLMDGPECGR